MTGRGAVVDGKKEFNMIAVVTALGAVVLLLVLL